MLRDMFYTRLTESSTTDKEGVGRLRIEDDGKIYRWVKNAESATAVTVGQAVCHTISELGDFYKSVKIPLTANLSALGGIVVSTSIAAASYGWIQVLGYNASISAIGATTGGADVAAASYLKGSNAAAHLVYDTTGTSAYRRYVQLLESIGTTTTPAAAAYKGVINCL